MSGGQNNIVTAPSSWCAGGLDNTVTGWWSSSVGGYQNDCQTGTIVGGENNLVSNGGTCVGGSLNQAVGQGATVTGGSQNLASGEYASVSGGLGRTASGSMPHKTRSPHCSKSKKGCRRQPTKPE